MIGRPFWEIGRVERKKVTIGFNCGENTALLENLPKPYLSKITFVIYLYSVYFTESYQKVRQYHKYFVYLHPKIDASSRAMRKSIC